MSLKKREDGPEPLAFLGCPQNVLDQSKNDTRTARVVCLSKDVKIASGSWSRVLRTPLLGCSVMLMEHIELCFLANLADIYLHSALPTPCPSYFLKESESRQLINQPPPVLLLLEPFADQGVPSVDLPRAAASEVLDFAFDTNLHRTQRQSGETQSKVCIDYSGAEGYPNTTVDSPGIQPGNSLRHRDS